MTPPLSWAHNHHRKRPDQSHAGGPCSALERFKKMLSGPPFTPPAFGKETIVAPGFAGGVEWGGLMTDPVNHVAFFNSNRIAWYYVSHGPQDGCRGGGPGPRAPFALQHPGLSARSVIRMAIPRRLRHGAR